MRKIMRRLSRKQRRRVKKVIRNALIRGSVLGAFIMLLIPSQAMDQGSLEAKVMCLVSAVYLLWFLMANYAVPFYDGHYHLWDEPWEDVCNSHETSGRQE